MTKILVYGQMELSIEMVTPAVAKTWLEKNVTNRRLRQHTCEVYSRDMKQGHWEKKPVAICFDENNMLGNGQHTLNAIVLSNCPQELLIARNVPRAAIAKMDTGLRRTITDIARFTGAAIDTRMAAIVKTVEWGVLDHKPRSFDEVFMAYMRHADAINMVCEHVPRKVPGVSAMTMAVCARAAYSQDHSAIKRFLTVLQTGMPAGDHESAAIKFCDYARINSGGGWAQKEETYNKAQNALYYFLEGKPLAKLYAASSELFSITPMRLAA